VKFTRTNIRAILTTAGMEAHQARKVVAQIIEVMAAVLAAGEVIELRGLGTLAPKERKARTRHNPRTMERVDVPARRVVFFRSSEKLKQAINGLVTEGADHD